MINGRMFLKKHLFIRISWLNTAQRASEEIVLKSRDAQMKGAQELCRHTTAVGGSWIN